MSRPKYLWYEYVKKSILYSFGCDMAQTQSDRQKEKFDEAVNAALARCEAQEDGKERLKMIDLVYKKRRYTVPGAAVQLHISERTAANWNKDFVYAVADEMGYL